MKGRAGATLLDRGSKSRRQVEGGGAGQLKRACSKRVVCACCRRRRAASVRSRAPIFGRDDARVRHPRRRSILTSASTRAQSPLRRPPTASPLDSLHPPIDRNAEAHSHPLPPRPPPRRHDRRRALDNRGRRRCCVQCHECAPEPPACTRHTHHLWRQRQVLVGLGREGGRRE
jgi:hypothetical protein